MNLPWVFQYAGVAVLSLLAVAFGGKILLEYLRFTGVEDTEGFISDTEDFRVSLMRQGPNVDGAALLLDRVDKVVADYASSSAGLDSRANTILGFLGAGVGVPCVCGGELPPPLHALSAARNPSAAKILPIRSSITAHPPWRADFRESLALTSSGRRSPRAQPSSSRLRSSSVPSASAHSSSCVVRAPATAIRADIGQALDVARNLTAQIAFHLDVAVDRVAQLLLIFFRKVLDPSVRIDSSFAQDLLRGRYTDAEDIGQPDFNPLLAGQVDAGDTSHQPCTCLCLGLLSQITRTLPSRRMMMHFSQMRLTDGRTFISLLSTVLGRA